jgi:hypothetical protein
MSIQQTSVVINYEQNTLVSTAHGEYLVTALVQGLSAMHAVWDAIFSTVICSDGKKGRLF